MAHARDHRRQRGGIAFPNSGRQKEFEKALRLGAEVIPQADAVSRHSKAERALLRLPSGARRDLLRVLASPSNVRADVIRQFHERGDDGMVDMLADLESDELLREQVVLLLQSLDR